MDNVISVVTVTPNDSDGTLVAEETQSGGVRGDNRALRLVFDSLNSAYRYQIEIVDGSGAYDITVPFQAKNGTLEYEIPAAWTAPGTAALRLVAIGEGENPVVRHYGPLHLHFADREDGTAMGEMLPRWQTVMAEAQEAAQKALVLAENSANILHVMVENGIASHSPSEIKAFRDNGGVVVVNDNAFFGYDDGDYGVLFFAYKISTDYIYITEYCINPNKSVNTNTYEHARYTLVDPTLSIYGRAADAGAVGRKFSDVESDIEVLLNATEKTNAVLRVTVEIGVASHSLSEIKAFRDAGGFVLLGDNAFLTDADEYYAYFESHKINLETVGRTEYMINDSKHVEIVPLNYEGITDKTLTKQWVAADAKAVGDKFSDMESDVDGLRTEIGDIETALDSILAIQEQLIGGDGE